MNISLRVGHYVDEIFYSGDPLSMELYLVKNAHVSIGIMFGYVIFCKFLGPYMMKDRKPFNLKSGMILLDVFLILTNAYVVWEIIEVLMRHGLRGLCMDPITESEQETRRLVISIASRILTLKIIEMLDSVIFVARKKQDQLSNLHVFHHSSVPFLLFLMFRSQRRMSLMPYGLVNCFTHVVMYFYYTLSAMGWDLKWKSYVTRLQIMQFLLMIPYMIYVAYSNCSLSKACIAIMVVHAVLMLMLFLDFYKNKFTRESRSLQHASPAAKKVK